MTSKLVVNEIAADTGISTITVGDNMSGVTFKTGTSNLHNVGIEIAGINVLGADTPIGAGATIYNSGDVLVGGAVTATAFSGSGASLSALNASNLGSGTVPNARFPATLPAASGVNLTALNGSNISSGTVAAARIDNLSGAKITSGTVAAARIDNLAASKITSGTLGDARIPNLNASKITAGTVATARLGSGTANNSSFLRGDQTWAAVTSTTINNNANNRVITGSGTANTLEGENHLQFNPNNSGDGILSVTAPEGGDARIQLNADENDDLYDRWELQSGADNHFYVNQMHGGGAYMPTLKFHSQRGNIEPIYDPIGLHGGGVVIAQANTNSGSSSDSPNFKVDFTVPSADINQIKRDGARQGFNSSTETGSYISPNGASGILIASCFGNYYWGFATKIYHISIYGSYGNNSDRAVSLNQLHSYSAAGHGSSNAHITLSVQSIPNNEKYTPKLRATFGGDYWSSNYLVVTYVGSGVASYANLRSLSHINSEITGQDTAWK